MLDNLTVHNRKILPLGFAMIITLMVIMSLVAVLQIKLNANSLLNSMHLHSENNNQLRNMAHAETSRSTLLLSMMETSDSAELTKLNQQLNAQTTKFNVARELLILQKTDDTLAQLLTRQTALSQIYTPMLTTVYKLFSQGEKQRATQLLTEQILPKQKAVLDVIKKMADYQHEIELSTNAASKSNNKKTLYSLLVFDVAGIFISIFLTRYILRRQKRQDKKLAYLATTDILTELPNRSKLTSNISSQITENPESVFAVVFFDIDYFKSINDIYGHEVGDELLREFANKISWFIKPQDILSRFGGDEFVLLLRSIKNEEDGIKLVEKLSKELDATITINSNEIFISASIGVSLFPKDGSSAKKLLTNADIAMYSSKQLGRNSYQLFSRKASDRIEKEHAINHALNSTLKNNNKGGQLSLKYQPLLNIQDGTSTECEALLRWTDHHGNKIPADHFIPIAEKSNLIEKLNMFVINEACKQQSIWQKDKSKDIRININLSGNKIIFTKLLERFKHNLKTYDLKPELFGIELTERTIHEVPQDTIRELDKLRTQGVKISIDDFGTGYSSLSYLKKLPITTLKIDKEFILGLPDDKADYALVKAIITLGHSLDLDVVAEGVENSDQLKFLSRYSCDIAQGYYYQRPLSVKKISHLQTVA